MSKWLSFVTTNPKRDFSLATECGVSPTHRPALRRPLGCRPETPTPCRPPRRASSGEQQTSRVRGSFSSRNDVHPHAAIRFARWPRMHIVGGIRIWRDCRGGWRFRTAGAGRAVRVRAPTARGPVRFRLVKPGPWANRGPGDRHRGAAIDMDPAGCVRLTRTIWHTASRTPRRMAGGVGGSGGGLVRRSPQIPICWCPMLGSSSESNARVELRAIHGRPNS